MDDRRTTVGSGMYREAVVDVPYTETWIDRMRRYNWRLVFVCAFIFSVMSSVAGMLHWYYAEHDATAIVVRTAWSRQRVLMERRDFRGHGWKNEQPRGVFHYNWCVDAMTIYKSPGQICSYEYHAWVRADVRTTGGSNADPVVSPVIAVNGTLQRVDVYDRYVVELRDVDTMREWSREVPFQSYSAFPVGRAFHVTWSRAGALHVMAPAR